MAAHSQSNRMRGALTRTGLLAPVIVLFLVFFATPLLYLFYVSFTEVVSGELHGSRLTLANYQQIAADSFYLHIIWRTVRVAIIILIIGVMLSYPIAVVLASIPVRWRLLLMALVLFPLMISNVVRAFGWVTILDRGGVVNTTLLGIGLIDVPIRILYTETAVVIGLLTILMPFMIVSITNSLIAIDPALKEAAHSLGAGPWRTFWNVTLPMSAPGVATGMLLVFLLSLSAYVTIAALGGPRSKLLVSLVYDSVVAFNWPRAAALSFVLLLVALSISVLILVLLRPNRVQGRG